MLPPRCRWVLRSSVMLHSENINTDIWQVSCEEGRRLAGELGRVAGFDRNGDETFNFTAGKKKKFTNSLEQNPASQIPYLFSKSRNSLQFTKPVSSLPYSQLPTTRSHTKLHLCSSLPPTPEFCFIKIYFNVILPAMPRFATPSLLAGRAMVQAFNS